MIKCKLELKDPGVLPVSQPLLRHPICQLEITDKEVDILVSAGILSKTSFPKCVNNVVLVRKRPTGNGNEATHYHVTADRRNLNLVLPKTQCVMPQVDAIINSLAGTIFLCS